MDASCLMWLLLPSLHNVQSGHLFHLILQDFMYKYGFTFDETRQEGDESVMTDGVTLLIDQMSAQYLTGAEVDYSEGLQGAQFVIRNPNATTTCGCGSSFSV